MLEKGRADEPRHENRPLDSTCFAKSAENAIAVYHYLLRLQRRAVTYFRPRTALRFLPISQLESIRDFERDNPFASGSKP
jgi:hypothetical protein